MTCGQSHAAKARFTQTGLDLDSSIAYKTHAHQFMANRDKSDVGSRDFVTTEPAATADPRPDDDVAANPNLILYDNRRCVSEKCGSDVADPICLQGCVPRHRHQQTAPADHPPRCPTFAANCHSDSQSPARSLRTKHRSITKPRAQRTYGLTARIL